MSDNPQYPDGYQQQPPQYNPYGASPPPPQNPPYGGPGMGQQQFDQFGQPLSDKTKVIAGVLGILLGGFGAGRFYTGHTNIALMQLGASIITCGLGSLWGMIDGIMILVNGGTDAQGRRLRDS